MKKLLSVAVLFALAGQVNAAVPVEERGVPRVDGSVSPAAVSPSANQVTVSSLPPEPVAQRDTFGTLQLLQQEVMSLRGLVEELNNEIRQLKQRQVDDYLDLDRRISGMATRSASSATGLPATSVNQSAPATNSSAPSAGEVKVPPADKIKEPSANEIKEYSAAYNLLKQGDIPAAKAALQLHTQNFPDGDYTPNAYYWLGEVYLLENDHQKAIQSFAMVVERYPVHRKAADARFKLGKSYHLAGDNQKALRYLKQSANGVGSSANLAKKYLSENF